MVSQAATTEIGELERPWWLPAVTPSATFAAVCTVFIVLIALYLPARMDVLFNTPDETVNHLYTKIYAETGTLWYDAEYLSLDEENLLHPRGVLTHDGRAVSYQFPTLPVVYGTLYRVVGENVKYIGTVFALMTVFFLYRTSRLLYDARYWQVVPVFLAATPLIFHFGRSYMAAGPAIMCFAGGSWLLTRYFRQSSYRDLALASGMFVLGMLFRYEFVIFSSLLVGAVLWHKHGHVSKGVLWRDLGTLGGIVAVMFLLPVMAANTVLYGSPFEYGYSIFNDVYLPDRGAQAGASFVQNIGRSALEVLLPQGTFDPELLGRNVARFAFGLMPLLGTLALLGGVVAFRRYRPPMRYFVPYAIVGGYWLIYMAGGDTFNATTKFATFDASFVRYWLPLSLLMVLLGGYAIRHFHDPIVQAVMALILVLYGAGSVLTLTHGSLSDVDASIDRYEEWAETVIVPNTEPNAIIYTGYVDKAILPYRNVAAWWGGTYNRNEVARSMARTFYAGYPVYVYKERYLSIIELNEVLRRYDVHAIATDGPALFKVVKVDHSRD